MAMVKGTQTVADLKKLKPEDDGSRYIFPAGEAAPGANIAPAVAAEPNAEDVVNPAFPVQQEVATSQSAFVNPSQAVEPQRGVATAAPTMQAPAAAQAPIPDNTDVGTKAIDDYSKSAAGMDDQLAKIQQERSAAIMAKLEEDEKDVQKIEPKSYFEGKNTWQKVLGGVGMFLGSITPEGARNVASIIEKEINRDVEAQKLNIKLKQDKKNSSYQKLLQKYGSDEAAILAKKKGAYDLLDMHLKKLEMVAKNQETRARLSMGREELQLKRDDNKIKMLELLGKQNKEIAKGSIPGYSGAPLDPTAKKELAAAVSSADTIKSSLSELKTLVKGTGESIPFTQANDRAKQLVNDVQLRLKDILNLGVLSESDAGRLEKYVSNPSLFTSDSRALAEIEGVLKLVSSSVDTRARSLGVSKNSVPGAREI